MNERMQKMVAMQAAIVSNQPPIAQQHLLSAYNAQRAAFQTAQEAVPLSPEYGLSAERAARCEHLTVYYIDMVGGAEGHVVREAKFPLSVIDGHDDSKKYQSLQYPYPAFGTRDAAEAFIRERERSRFRDAASSMLKSLTELIFKRGCTGDGETKLLNDMQDCLRGDK
jgi:hypothetical protein